jgi:hypothetical protein
MCHAKRTHTNARYKLFTLGRTSLEWDEQKENEDENVCFLLQNELDVTAVCECVVGPATTPVT